ncbi:hypothetical protein FACS1894153_0390 [Bacteroidia bacterium]|nr:hypothetical protein FACS1894153_0390 [Bacteroidia bacterium]
MNVFEQDTNKKFSVAYADGNTFESTSSGNSTMDWVNSGVGWLNTIVGWFKPATSNAGNGTNFGPTAQLPQKSNTSLYIGIGILVLVFVGVLIWYLRKSKK